MGILSHKFGTFEVGLDHLGARWAPGSQDLFSVENQLEHLRSNRIDFMGKKDGKSMVSILLFFSVQVIVIFLGPRFES